MCTKAILRLSQQQTPLGYFAPGVTFLDDTRESGSDAINAVTCADAPLVDQRGYLRPAPADVGLATPCDIGAVEVGSQASDRIFADGFGLPPVYK